MRDQKVDEIYRILRKLDPEIRSNMQSLLLAEGIQPELVTALLPVWLRDLKDLDSSEWMDTNAETN
jgi:hypothetical protein